MFGLGASEIVVILALALIVFGPQKLPELAKQLARLMGDLRRAADDVKHNFDEATRDPPPPPPPPPVAVQALLNASQQQSQHKAPNVVMAHPSDPHHPPPDAHHPPIDPHHHPVNAPHPTPDAHHPAPATPPVMPTAAPVGTVSAQAPDPDIVAAPTPAPTSPSSGGGHG